MAKRAAPRTGRRAAHFALLAVAFICVAFTPSTSFYAVPPGPTPAETVTSGDEKPAMKEDKPLFITGPGFLKFAASSEELIGINPTDIAEKHGVQCRKSSKGQYFPWSKTPVRRKVLAFSGAKEGVLSAFRDFRKSSTNFEDANRTWMFLFPKPLVTELLRDRGEVIKRFKENSGVQVNIDPVPGNEAILFARAKGDEADKVAEWLVSLLPDDDAERLNAIASIATMRYSPQEVVEKESEIYVAVPTDKEGAIIGKGGSNLNRLRKQFRVDLQLGGPMTLEGGQKLLRIKGLAGDVDACHKLLLLGVLA